MPDRHIDEPDDASHAITSDATVPGEDEEEKAASLAHPESPTEQSTDSPTSEAISARYSSHTTWQKRWIVLAASLAAFFSPLSAQIYFPALNVIAEQLDVTETQINLTITTYMILQGIVPMLVGGFADTGGRRPAYIFCFVVYIAACIGIALCRTYASLLVLRALQSAGSASTIALCQAVVADTITSAERGSYIGITVLPIVLSPSLGPVLGGVFSQFLGWRSIFWFLAILAAITLVLMLLFFPETCRAIVGDGSIRPHPAYRTVWQLYTESRTRHKNKRRDQVSGLQRTTTDTSSSSKKPLKVNFGDPFSSIRLLFKKEMGLLLGYSSIVFCGFYCISTALPSQFAAIYGYSELIIGLMYLPMAAGSVVAAFGMAPLVSWNYRRHALKIGMPIERTRQQDLSKFPIERARLEIGLPLLALATVATIGWGWSLQARTHVAVPCVMMFFLGVGMIGFSNTTSVLVVDLQPTKAGAATAANNLTRCLVGAVATAVILPVINAIGVGWAFTLVGALYVVFLPAILVLMRCGIRWRRERRERDQAKSKRKLEKS